MGRTLESLCESKLYCDLTYFDYNYFDYNLLLLTLTPDHRKGHRQRLSFFTHPRGFKHLGGRVSLAYPHTRIPAYPHTPIPAYPHTHCPPYKKGYGGMGPASVVDVDVDVDAEVDVCRCV